MYHLEKHGRQIVQNMTQWNYKIKFARVIETTAKQKQVPLRRRNLVSAKRRKYSLLLNQSFQRFLKMYDSSKKVGFFMRPICPVLCWPHQTYIIFHQTIYVPTFNHITSNLLYISSGWLSTFFFVHCNVKWMDIKLQYKSNFQ